MINVIKLTLSLTLRNTRSYSIWNKSLQIKNVTNYINIPSNRFLKINSCPKKKMPLPSALVLLATGTEEIEFVTVVDVLRRGNVKVTVSGIDTSEIVKCRCDTMIRPEKFLSQANCDAPFGVIVLPGGLEAAKLFSESVVVGKVLKAQESSKGLIAAICAAPTALKAHGICKGYNVTCYPALSKEMCEGDIYKYHDNRPVIIDKNLITSRGPATSMFFAFAILGEIMGDKVAKEVADGMLFDYSVTKVMQKVN